MAFIRRDLPPILVALAQFFKFVAVCLVPFISRFWCQAQAELVESSFELVSVAKHGKGQQLIGFGSFLKSFVDPIRQQVQFDPLIV